MIKKPMLHETKWNIETAAGTMGTRAMPIINWKDEKITLEFLYALQKTTRWTVVLQNLLNYLARRRTKRATWRHPEHNTSFLECTQCKMKMVKMSIHLQYPMICKKTQQVRKACMILRNSKDSPTDQVDERINNISIGLVQQQ